MTSNWRTNWRELAGMSAIDLSIDYRGQIYKLIGEVQHTKPSGEVVDLIEWHTECPTCGVGFVVRTTRVFRWPNRRCAGCKAPGRRVKK